LLVEVIVPKKVEITCDFCQKNLTNICSGYDETRLHLESQDIYNTSNISFGMPMRRELGDCYFCDLSCLEGWLTQRAPDLGQAVEKNDNVDVAPCG